MCLVWPWQGRSILQMNVVKCKANEKCIPKPNTQIYGLNLGICEPKTPSKTNPTHQCAKMPTWMRPQARIIGGQNAPEPIPWQVHIQYEREGKMIRCGGTILDEETILTAAECFRWYETRPLGAKVYTSPFIEAGVTNLGSSTGQKILVRSMYYRWGDNIAIVRLFDLLQFNSNVQPVCLPDTSFEPKSIGWVSGWGKNESGEWSTTLKFTNVHINAYNECKLYRQNITENMVCSFGDGGNGDVCTGDIGGPLVVSGMDDSAILYGIVSETSCGDLSVYIQVTNYLDWIKQMMKKENCGKHGGCYDTWLSVKQTEDYGRCLTECQFFEGPTPCKWFTYHTDTKHCLLLEGCKRFDSQNCTDCLSGEASCPLLQDD